MIFMPPLILTFSPEGEKEKETGSAIRAHGKKLHMLVRIRALAVQRALDFHYVGDLNLQPTIL
jgi:hypothetical protein